MRPIRPFSAFRSMARLALTCLALMGALTIQVSCGGGGGGGSTGGGSKTLSSVTITPAAPKVALGTALQLKATGNFSDGSTQDLTASATWSSATPAVGTVSGSGLASGLTAGTTLIKAVSSGITGSATLTVTNATLTSISVSPANPVVAKGATQSFTATGHFSDGSTEDLSLQATWSSSSTAVATISSSGVATGVAAGSATLRATFGSVSGSTGILVTPGTGVSLTGITLSPANPKIAAGTSLQFKATGTFSDSSTADVSLGVAWASSSPAVGTVNATGLAAGVAAGTSTLSATSGSITGSTVLTVSSATLAAIAVSPVDPFIPVAGTQAFTATGSFSDGSTQNLTSQVAWSSSATAVATVNSTGTATGVAAGTATIRATKGAVSGSTTLTVTPTPGVTLVSLAVAPANPTIAATTTQQFTATGTFSNGSKLDLTASVAWTSSATAAATINATGLATGVAAGSTTISATAGTVSASTTLTVTNATLASLAVTPANATLAAGFSRAYTATGTFSDGSTQ
ncbi:MAG TPA: Ig-like domain-containing protein, partial [Holophagaceae bacterium]|nr:Ig-like domain-containing protein [Holophagaceae bacterium]